MFEGFIDDLARTEVPDDAMNQYAYDDPLNEVRRHNLLLYLQQMQAMQPQVMLIAEAPGYKGMRLTGVPFSSRAFVRDGIDGVSIFGTHNGYIEPTDDYQSEREQTATIVWSVLKDVRPLPLSWNSYPFHPHRPGKLLSNRKPRKPEIEIGRPFLLKMLEMFPVKTVIAVGNTADDTLNMQDIDHLKVRHPAQGGKNDFVAGLTEILRNLNLIS